MCSINMINSFLNFQQGQEILLFSTASRLALGPTDPPVQKGTGAFLQWGR